jgi:hypothetical protein
MKRWRVTLVTVAGIFEEEIEAENKLEDFIEILYLLEERLDPRGTLSLTLLDITDKER